MLALRLFGGLSLESDTVPVPPGALQRRRLTLLALLALAGERGMSRERLQAHLWPESDADRARHGLDQLLYATRRDLGPEVILSGSTELRLNAAVVRPDTWAFAAALREAEWAEAERLYTGPVLEGVHLLGGAEFERLVDVERGGREHDYHQVLETLASMATVRSDLEGAVRWRRRRFDAEPLSTRVTLALMSAAAAAGDRSAAVQHGRVHQRLVRAVFETEPDAAVEAFAVALSTPPDGATSATSSVSPIAPSLPLSIPADEAALSSSSLSSRRRGVRVPEGGVGVIALTIVLALVAMARLSSYGPRATVPSTAQPAGRPVRAADTGPTRSAGRDAFNSPVDARARLLYLRGRTAWERRTERGLAEAVVLYRLASERDPTYAAAFAGLAESYVMLGYFGFAPADPMFSKASAAARHALEIDPRNGEAYSALGQALAWQHDWAGSERANQRALELAPENATVHQWYALMLAYVGRATEAAQHTAMASRLDPLSVQINNMHGMMLYYAGDLDGALRQYERTVDAEPDSAWVRQNPWVLSNFGHVAGVAGRYPAAIGLIERALQVVPNHPRPLLDLAAVYIQMREPERARTVFARADTAHPQYRLSRGLLHAQLGELDQAFDWLASVDAWPLASLVGLSNDPRYRALRADPRYRAIRARLDLPGAITPSKTITGRTPGS